MEAILRLSVLRGHTSFVRGESARALACGAFHTAAMTSDGAYRVSFNGTDQTRIPVFVLRSNGRGPILGVGPEWA